MTIIDAVTELADQLSDALTPPGTMSSSGTTPSGGALGRVFAEPSRTGADDRLILAAMVELTRVLNLCTTALAGAAEAADRAGIPFRKRVKTATDLLKQLGHPPAVAHRLFRVGAAAASLPELSRQARTGAVAVEQADAVGRGIAFVDKRVRIDETARRDLARRLAVQATPADIDRRARELAIEWAPAIDEADQELVPIAENADLNEMTLVTGADGRTSATIDLDALTGEELNQALDPLCKPIPQTDGSRDPRSATQRRADAFGQVIRDYLAGNDRPTSSGGVLPHVTLIVPINSISAPGKSTQSVSAQQDSTPARGPSPVAALGFTGPVSPTTVGLVLCEAAMRRVVLDADSAPLDFGREHRLVTVALRKALEARDRGCAFPGCGRPVSWTDAHHCVPWSEGGVTAIDNCVLLCRMHHTVVHHTGWEVFIGHDRHPWFRAPLDPAHPRRTREAIRSNARRTLTIEPAAA